MATKENDTQACHRHWLEWNLFRRGKHKGAHNSITWKDDVMTYNTTPCLRFVPIRQGSRSDKLQGVVLVRHHALDSKRYDDIVKSVSVPDLAVFSRFDGDRLEGAAMHERVQWIMYQRVKHFIDERLVPRPDQQMETHAQRIDNDRLTLADYIRRYQEYSDLFNLGWSPLPDTYLTAYDRMVGEKLARWHNPKAVLRRERQGARRAAVRALDLQQPSE